MNYWIMQAQLTAIELDIAGKDLLKAYRRSAPEIRQHQNRWDELANEMQSLNGICERRSPRTEKPERKK